MTKIKNKQTTIQRHCLRAKKSCKFLVYWQQYIIFHQFIRERGRVRSKVSHQHAMSNQIIDLLLLNIEIGVRFSFKYTFIAHAMSGK